MNAYSDEIEKLNYYKQRIVGAMAKNGQFPSDMEVQRRLADIDTKLAVFRFHGAAPGAPFDTARFNAGMEDIRTDLVILYRLAYQHCIQDYEEIKSYVDTHLQELEAMADGYQRRMNLELNTTGLGKTIFLQTNGFRIDSGNTVRRIDLGPLSVRAGSELACIFTGTGIDQKQVVFDFGEAGSCSAYGYNSDTFPVKGRIIHRDYRYAIPSASTEMGGVLMDPAGLSPHGSLRYDIYAGENAYRVQDAENHTLYAKKVSREATVLEGDGTVSFHIVGATYASFEFAKEPVDRNFTDLRFTPDEHQFITMEYHDGMAFDLYTDGTVYAEKERGIVRGGMLYYPVVTSLTSFRIEEYDSAEDVRFDHVAVVISGIRSGAPLYVHTIAIKAREGTA